MRFEFFDQTFQERHLLTEFTKFDICADEKA